MLARLKSLVRAVRLAAARRLRRVAEGDLLSAEGALACVLLAGRVAAVAAGVAVAAWVLVAARHA